MVFEAPLWLLGLLPWSALVFFLLLGKGRPQAVPHLNFWKGTSLATNRTTRRFPPIAVGLILLALLLAVLAAGRPATSTKGHLSGDVTIILDRGVSMALPSSSGQPFRGVIQKCSSSLGSLGSETHVTLVAVPGPTVETTGNAWITAAQALSATIFPVKLDAIIADRLRHTTGSVLVLTDQSIGVSDPRLTQIWPDAPEPCVAITSVAARSSPVPQAMIRLENHSARGSVQLKINSSGSAIQRTISLPPADQTKNQFVDLADPSDVLTAEIDSDPKQNPWARAFLVRQPLGSIIMVDHSLPNSVQRIAEIFSKDRRTDQLLKSILISSQPIDDEQSGIWLQASSSASTTNQTCTVTPHPLTKNVTAWPTPGEATSPPAGFTQVVLLGQRAVVAVRENPARQIWINADFRDWENTTNFVIFFANAFDWLSGDGGGYTSTNRLPTAITWPGIYRDDTGKQIAINAGSFPINNQSRDVPKVSISLSTRQQTLLESWVMLTALACLTLAALLTPPLK